MTTLRVDKWDATSEEKEAAGLVDGQEFEFSEDEMRTLMSKPCIDVDCLVEVLMKEATNRTGFCIVACSIHA